MPTNQRFDYELGGNGFMLVRAPSGQRAWNRTGYPDAPTRRSQTDVMYGNVPDTIDHPEVWNDWSGGFGDAYEVPERPNSYHWSRGFDLRFPRQAIHAQAPRLLDALRYSGRNVNADSFLDVPSPAIGGPPEPAGVLVIGAMQFSRSTGLVPGGNLYLGPTIYQNTTASAFVPTNESLPGVATQRPARRAITVGSYSYIPNLAATGFLRRDFEGVYTLGPQEANWFEVAAGRIWFGFNRDKVRSVSADADPMATANYAATLPIGKGAELKDAIALEDQLYMGNREGAYQGNLSGTFKNVLQDIGGTAHQDNCRDLTSFQAGLVAPVGPHLYWYKPSTGGNAELREIGPSGLFANRSAIRGRFTCVKGHGRWLYAGLFTGSESWFLVGRDASPPLPYVWHPLHNFLGLTCKVSRIHVDGITTISGPIGTRIPNRIWCATDASFGAGTNATAPIFWWPIPQGDNSPLSDLTFSPNYMGSARLDLPSSEWGAPGASKTWRAAEVWAEGMASGAQYADLYWALDGATRATLGRVQDSPRTTSYFPAGEGSFVAGQALALSVDSFTASINVTPVYRAMVVRGTLMPRSNDLIEARTRIADHMVDRHSTPMEPAARQITRLRGYAAGSAPTLLTDLTGATAWVKVQPPIEESEMYQQGEQEAEIMATVRMAVLEFSSGP